MSKITVGVPAYNRPELLAEALRCIQRQTFQDFEVIVSDNASTEDLIGVVASFNDERMKIVRHPVSIGMVANWRYSLMAAHTEYVAWLHGDDTWEVDHLERAFNALESNQAASLYTCVPNHFNESGITYVQKLRGYESATRPVKFSARESFPLWLDRMNCQCSSIALRRKYLDDISWGKIGMDYNIDYLIIAQICLAGDWIYDPKPTAGYRIHSNSVATINKKGRKQMIAHTTYIHQFLIRLGIERGFFDERSLLEDLTTQEVDRQASLLTAFASWHMPKRARDFAKQIVARNPAILSDARSSRNCQLAGKIGTWYLSIADHVNQIRLGWRPTEEQLSAWTDPVK